MREAIFKKLKKEKPILEWAVKLQRHARRDRLKVLKKKGLI